VLLPGQVVYVSRLVLSLLGMKDRLSSRNSRLYYVELDSPAPAQIPACDIKMV
jgi:hypothetical protein